MIRRASARRALVGLDEAQQRITGCREVGVAVGIAELREIQTSIIVVSSFMDERLDYGVTLEDRPKEARRGIRRFALLFREPPSLRWRSSFQAPSENGG